MGTATAVYEVKNALFAAAKTLFASDEIEVSFGFPATRDFDDYVVATGFRSEQATATMSPNRARNEDVYVSFSFDFYRAGEGDDKTVTDAAVDAVQRLEHYVRVTDPTLGGTCQWCFLESVDSEGVTDLGMVTRGRQCVIDVVFHAFVRVTG